MALDLIWASGEALSIVALLSGAYLVLMESEPLLRLFGKKSVAPLSLSPRDLRLIGGLTDRGATAYFLSGNGVVDMQHQRVCARAKDLRAAILSGQTVGDVNVLIDALLRDVVQQFRDEEAIFAAADYPGLATHAALHRGLINNASTLVGQFRTGKLGIGSLFGFLAADVVAGHMLSADRVSSFLAVAERSAGAEVAYGKRIATGTA